LSHIAVSSREGCITTPRNITVHALDLLHDILSMLWLNVYV